MNSKNNKLVFLIRICVVVSVLICTSIQTICAQNSGLNFQGVARNPSGVILASQNISLRFSVLNTSTTGTAEYIETRNVVTNGQGIFSIVIGDGTAAATVNLGTYANINWKTMPKFLKVELDPNAGSNFFTMGVTQLQTVPYSNYSNYSASVDADNILGIVPVSKGGTGANDLNILKTNLTLNKVDNTADLDKPISVATQNGLNNKLAMADSLVTYVTPTQLKSTRVDTSTLSNRIDLKENVSNKSTAIDLGGSNPSDILFPTQKAVKTYVAANASAGGISDGGVTTIKLADGAVTDAKISSNISRNKVGLSNVENVALSTWNGTTNLNTLGVINTGTWSGTMIAVDKGGTGVSTTTANYVFAGPNSQNGTPGFRALTSNDIPTNLTGYIQNSPSSTQTGSIDISGSLTASGIKMNAGNSSLINFSVGINSLESITTGNANSAIGREALKYNQNGSLNNAFGIRALYWNVTGINNSAFGSYSLADNYGGNYNSAFGARALQKNYSSSNNAFGSKSLFENLSGYGNNAFGTNSLTNNTSGINNSAFGDQSLLYNSTGGANSAFGAGALLNNTTSFYNSAFGAAALYSNTLGSTNSAFGNKSLYATTNGYDNTAMGSQSAYSNTEGIGNTSVGLTSLYNTTTGNGNSAFGKNALNTNVSGDYNLAIGFGADVDASSYSNAIAIGYNAIVNGSNKIQLGNANIISVNTSGAITAGSIQNTPIGNLTPRSGVFSTLSSISDMTVNGVKIGIGSGGNYTNSIFGYNAFVSNTTGAGNVAIGEGTLNSNTLGNANIAIGSGSLQFNTIGNYNISLGPYALRYNQSGNNNIAMGISALAANTTGSNNMAFGSSALNMNTIGVQNTALGIDAMKANTIGSNNIAIGANALRLNTDGNQNISLGIQSLFGNISGNENIAFGTNVLKSNTTGGFNSALGSYSLVNNTIGDGNTAFGKLAMNTNVSGNYNVAIGYGADVIGDNYNNAIAIGYDAKVNASNKIRLGNSSITEVVTSGNLTLGNVTYPNSHGAAGQVLTTTGAGTLSWTTPTSSNGSNSSTLALLEQSITPQGFLPPKLTKVQRDAIVSPTSGLMIWCIDNFGGEIEVFTGRIWINMMGVTNSTLSIGDYYQGGKVAYILQSGDPGYDANTQHGMIAAISDQSTSITWYNGTYTITGAAGTAIGTGLTNTNKIIISQGGDNPINYAAGLARAYKGGGYTDWCLPSKDELYQLYLNKAAIGGLTDLVYWSSSESNLNVTSTNSNYAWGIGLNLGGQVENLKYNTRAIRAIRYF